MDFVERILGIAPDNGNGLTEVAILVALAGVLFLAWRLRGRLKGRLSQP